MIVYIFLDRLLLFYFIVVFYFNVFINLFFVMFLLLLTVEIQKLIHFDIVVEAFKMYQLQQ